MHLRSALGFCGWLIAENCHPILKHTGIGVADFGNTKTMQSFAATLGRRCGWLPLAKGCQIGGIRLGWVSKMYDFSVLEQRAPLLYMPL